MGAPQMSETIGDRRNRVESRSARGKPARLARNLVLGVLAPACLGVCSILLFAAGQVPKSPSDGAAVRSAPSRFVAESRKALRTLREEMVRLGSRVAHDRGGEESLRDEAVNQEITVKSAEADYENAKLSREVAEIGVKEYEEGIFLQDRQTAEGEVILAESDLSRAADAIEITKQRLAAIRKAAKGSAIDLVNEYSFEDLVDAAERRQPRARLAVEAARAKLAMLEKYTRPRRVNELKSEVEQARTVELAKQSRVVSERLKLTKLKAAQNGGGRPVHEERVLELLWRAVQLEERLEAMLGGETNAAEPGPSVRAEFAKELETLEATVESVRNEQAAAAWARLKTQIPRAATTPAVANPD